MKTTSVIVLAFVCASTLAQPIVLLKDKRLDTRDITPTIVTDLESRKFHMNWGAIGKGLLGLVLKRDENGDLSLAARDLVNDNGELAARYFDDDFLEARDFEDDLEARDFDDDFLEARDFDDNYLYGRDFEDDLEARDFDDNYLYGRDFEDDLEARDFDDSYLETRDFDEDLEARGFHDDHPHLAAAGHMAYSVASGALGENYGNHLEERGFTDNHPVLSSIGRHAYNHFAGGGMSDQYRKRDLDLEARDFDEDLEARGFTDNHPVLSAIGHHAYNHFTGGNQYGDQYNQYRKRDLDLEKREFDEDLEARGFSDDHPILRAIGHHAYNHFSGGNQYGDQYDQYRKRDLDLEEREFDEDLEARSLFSTIGRLARGSGNGQSFLSRISGHMGGSTDKPSFLGRISRHAYNLNSKFGGMGGQSSQYGQYGRYGQGYRRDLDLEARDFDEDLEARSFSDNHPHISAVGRHVKNFFSGGSSNQYPDPGSSTQGYPQYK